MTARLQPVAPHRGSEARVDASPFWVGSGEGCGLRLRLPGIAERHAAVLEREDGCWLVPVRAVRPAPRVNGVMLTSELRLQAGDVIELLPGVSFRFATGERHAARGVHRLRRRIPWPNIRERLGRTVGGLPDRAGWFASAVSLLLAFAAGAMLVRAIPSGSAARPLADEDAERFDALTYAVAQSPRAPSAIPRGAIPPDEFARRFQRVQQRFSARFGRPIVVTGRDHPEHLSLYGAGSALDLRVRDLSPEQVSFAVAALRAEGIRVKDFSDDAVLRAQIRSAHAAGLPDRAGTGLHLHADRFPGRHDRWTVR